MTPTTTASFASILRAARTAAHLTSFDVAAAARVSPSSIGRWESGHDLPRPLHLHAAVAFMCDKLPAGLMRTQLLAVAATVPAPPPAKLKALQRESAAAMLYGRRVREARGALGFPRSQFAPLVGTSDAMMNRWEAGALSPPAPTMLRIAAVLDIPATALTTVKERAWQRLLSQLQSRLSAGHHSLATRQRVGANLREAREAAGLTQSELSRRTGVAQPTISAIEAGTRPPRPESLRTLARALRVDPAMLAMTSPVGPAD